MKGFPGGMQGFMRQVNQMQSRVEKKQQELKEQEYESTSGGGAVTVKVNGDYQITALNIQEDVVKEGDPEMLQDLILTATNDALKNARETSDKEMSKVTGGMNFPGLF